jgi:hypothetical protein
MVKHDEVEVYDFDEVEVVLLDDEVLVLVDLVEEALVEVDLLALGNHTLIYFFTLFHYIHDYKKASKYRQYIEILTRIYLSISKGGRTDSCFYCR